MKRGVLGAIFLVLLAVPVAGQAVELGVGAVFQNGVPMAIGQIKILNVAVEGGVGFSRVNILEDGTFFTLSVVCTTGIGKFYVPTFIPFVEPYIGAGLITAALSVREQGQPLPLIEVDNLGFQLSVGLELKVPIVPLAFFAAGSFSTLNTSLAFQSGGRLVNLAHPIKSNNLSVSVGFRLNFFSFGP